MKKQRIVQLAVVMVLLIAGILFCGAGLAAAIDTSEAGTADSITQFDDRIGGYSHVGVKVYWEDQLECYALDTYKKNAYGVWQYVLSNINGTVKNAEVLYRDGNSPIWLSSVNNSAGGRFNLRTEKVKKGRSDYSDYVEIYMEGELSWSGYEIAGVQAGQHGTDTCGSRSFKEDDNPEVGGFTADGVSIIYRVYDPRIIEPDGDELSLDAHGGSVEKNGKAYYRKEGLYLFELPVVSMNKPGYTCIFQGWYDAAQGGKEYKVGDILQKGDVLHARWSIAPNDYNVTCIDVRGNSPDGEELGRRSWKAKFGTTAKASAAGADKAVGAYYPHCYYNDSTTAQVTTDGAVVYRYFSYESCPVEYIDQIEDGSRAGEMLSSCSQRKEYSSTVHGSDIGTDASPGTYHQGYYYTRCTSQQVREQGTVVYRYFKPIEYTIVMDGNGATEGEMANVANCQYDRAVSLEKSCFRKESVLTLHRNSKDDGAEDSRMSVTQKFLGWATQKNGAVRYADGETVKNITAQNGTVTLYAVWSEENVALPTLAAPMGYRFLGWAEAEDARTGLMQMNVADSKDLYAVWERDRVKYHVEYYKENLEGGYDLTGSYQFDGYTDDEVSVDSADHVSPGFVLDRASSKLTGIIKADGSLILCAYYCRAPYDLRYDLNGGTLDSGDELKNERIKFGTALVLPAVIPHRDGYLFQGWVQDEEETNILFQPRDSFVMKNHDVTLRARWKKVSFKVKYDNNAEYSRLSGITGTVPDTEYIYQQDSYASAVLYQSEEAELIFWNTKPDGSGISVLPGTNMRGLFDDEEGLTLYAVWKRNDSDEYVSFRLKLWLENGGDSEVLDTLQLYGKPGERISVALLRLFQKELSGESVIYFYKGYEVVNKEGLEKIIALESDTEVSLTVKERKCIVTFPSGIGNEEGSLLETEGKYHEEFILPESFSDGKKVDRYEDNEGNHYFPGDKIILEKNIRLYPQQAIHLHDEKGGEKDVIVYVNRGTDYTLPELSVGGFRLLGWSDSMGESIGAPGQIVKNIICRCDFYARWSEPLVYQITYDLENTGVKILENSVARYQYTKGAVLPNASQLVVPDGYQFDGWYESGDEKKTLMSSISSKAYGDKVLKPHLSQKSGNQGNGDKEHPGDENPSGSGNGNQNGDGSQPGSGNGSQGGDGSQSGTGNGSQSGDGNQSGTGNDSQSGDGNQSSSGNGNQGGDGNQPGSGSGDQSGNGNHSGSGNGNQSGDGNQPGTGNGNQSGNGSHSGSGNGNQSGDEDQPGTGNGSQDGNGNSTGSGDGDKNSGSPNQGNSHLNLKKKPDQFSAGTTFWKGKVKYKILLPKNGKYCVKVIAVKKRARKISIPGKVTYRAKSFRVSAIANKAFHKAKTVRVIVPGTIVNIKKKTFAGMKCLKRVTLGEGIKSIGKKAFWKDKKLIRVVIRSKKVSKISKNAFGRINKKATIQIPRSKKKAYRRLLAKSVQGQNVIIRI